MKKSDDIIIKQISIADLEHLHRLEVDAWGEKAAAMEEIERRIVLSGSSYYGAYSNDIMVGSFVYVKVRFDKVSERKWVEYLNHFEAEEKGANCLYVVSLTAHPKAPRGVGRQLLSFANKISSDMKLDYIAYGSRIPGYTKFKMKTSLSVEGYINKVKSGAVIDPVLSLANLINFTIGDPIVDYYDDRESENYGVIVFAEN